MPLFELTLLRYRHRWTAIRLNQRCARCFIRRTVAAPVARSGLLKDQRLVQVALLNLRQDVTTPRHAARVPAVWHQAESVVVIVKRQPDLFQVVLALCPTCCLSSLLHSGQQQRNQNRDNGDDNQQLNQCKSTLT
jgi:hypothetical protein